MTIQKVAVIGSGVMGSGIAAQIANSGTPVVLLDIKPADGSNLAAKAVERMLKTDPAPFMSPKNAALITCGNMEDDLALLGDCDWIIEVVLEDLAVKHKTYALLNKHRKKGSIISSNTSTIPLHKLIEGQGEEFASDFLITHFFNPPRYMRLLELVVGDKTRQDAIDTVAQFCDVQLGKGVVRCHDTPGFIANRLGVFWLQTALNEALSSGITIEAADAVMGKPVGIPKTGVFGLIDLVGIDLMPKLAASMLSTLPDNDEYRRIYKNYPMIDQMIAAGYTGRKGKGGFYRLNPDAAKKKEKQALNLNADQFNESMYRKEEKPKLASVDAGKGGLRAVLETDDEGGRFACAVLVRVLAYAASLVPEIADDIASVDEAMRLGYNFKKGPFEMIDDLGAPWLINKIEQMGLPAPQLLKDIGKGKFYTSDPIVKNWAHLNVILETEPAMLVGINLWEHKWERLNVPPVRKHHPNYPDTKYRADVYKVSVGGNVLKFAACEVSPNVWSFWIPAQTINNDRSKLHYFGTDGVYVPVVRPQGVLLLRDIKLAQKPVFKTSSAALWDIGDGVLCIEFTGKMNTMDEQVFEVYHKAIALIGKDEGQYKALVIYNEGSAFSAGANLGLALFAMNIALWAQVEQLIAAGQQTYKALKFAPFPVVAAPSGLALGGGCEILLHADHVQAHAETYTGLVEVGVGLIPGWGGCKEMILRFQQEEAATTPRMWFSPKNTPMGAVRKAFETIGTAKVAKSAQDAKELGYFRATDGITMNRDRLLFDAKQKALELAKNYKAPEPVKEIRLPGASGKYALDMAVADLKKSGKATPYDVTVSSALAAVLTGGDKGDWTKPLSEDDLLKLEISEFMKLVKNDGTIARVEHMLETGKPLRN